MPTEVIIFPPPSTPVSLPDRKVEITQGPKVAYERSLPEGVVITPAPPPSDLPLRLPDGVVIREAPQEMQRVREAPFSNKGQDNQVEIVGVPQPEHEKKILANGSYWEPMLKRYVAPDDKGWSKKRMYELYPEAKEASDEDEKSEDSDSSTVASLLKNYSKSQLVSLSEDYGISEAEKMTKTEIAKAIIDAVSNGDG